MKCYKKALSLVLVLAMVITTVCISSVSVFAAGESQVYFDNSAYNWENVYVYAYGTKENAEWPGQLMTKNESGMYTMTFPVPTKQRTLSLTMVLKRAQVRSSILKMQAYLLKQVSVSY